MPNATAALLGTFISKVTAQALSSAAGSVDVLTIAHQLGTSPDFVTPVLRSVVNSVSGGAPAFAVLSYNGSQAVIHMPPALSQATNAILDVLCEYKHSIVR